MKKLIFVVLILFSLVGISHTLEYNGSLSSGNGLTGTGYWHTDVTFEWNVTYLMPFDLWKYEYVLTVPRKDISNIIIEASDLFSESNIFDGSTCGYEIGTFPCPGNSAPYIPDEIRGIKYEVNNMLVFSVTLITDKSPVWGDFYSKDGCTAGTYNTVYNTGFGNPDFDPSAPASDGSVDNHILRPDTLVINNVPEPLSLILLLSSILFLLRIRK